MWGIGGGLGVLLGGFLGQALYNWRKGAMPFYAGVSIILTVLPILWLINGDVHHHQGLGLFVAFVGGALSSPPGPCARWVLSSGRLARACSGIGLHTQVTKRIRLASLPCAGSPGSPGTSHVAATRPWPPGRQAQQPAWARRQACRHHSACPALERAVGCADAEAWVGSGLLMQAW